MERKKMTKALIGESLKVLMHDHPFEKITIKMITDEAGVIRPTFYNYFCDKYEVVEWIFNENIIEKVRSMFEQKMYTEGLKLLFVCMKNDCTFYKKAFEITGQNAFTDIVKNSLYQLFITEVNFSYIESQSTNPLLTPEMVAAFYSISLANLLQLWIRSNNQEYTAENMVEAYALSVTEYRILLFQQKNLPETKCFDRFSFYLLIYTNNSAKSIPACGLAEY